MAVAELKFANFRDIDLELGSRATLKLAHNTIAYRLNNEIGISYHGNEIARYDSVKRRITLSTAGWPSITTLGRLNQLSHANRIGWVGLHDGEAILTAFANPFAPEVTADRGDWLNPDSEYTAQCEERYRAGAWHRLSPSIEFDMDKGVIYGGDHDHVDGLSNLDTAKAWKFISANDGIELIDLPKAELREWIKSNRKNIGYKTINAVNVNEIHNLLLNIKGL